MEKILEKVDKILKKVRQEGKVEVQTRVGLLYELIRRTEGKQITFEVEGPQGRKEKLMVSERGISLLDKDTYTYNKMIDFTSGGNKKEAIKIFANSSGRIKNILDRALLGGEVEIEIT